jgi:hypothetical protein
MKHILPGLLLCGVLGCAERNNVSLQIVRSIAPDSSCAFGPSNASIDAGGFDPTFGQPYTLGMVLRNNLETEDDDPSKGFAGQNNRPRTNDILLQGFQTCIYRAADMNVLTAPDCDDVPAAQRANIPSAETIDRQGSAAVGIQLLGVASLQTLYSASFDPTSIPTAGADPTGTVLSASAESPGSGRSASWGTFPADTQDTIIIQVRAIGRTQGGNRVESDWLRFPVQLCIHCYPSCGDLGEQLCAATTCTDQTDTSQTLDCPNPCSSGICTHGSCSDGTTCGGSLTCRNLNGSLNSAGAQCYPTQKRFPPQSMSFASTCLSWQGLTPQPTCTSAACPTAP